MSMFVGVLGQHVCFVGVTIPNRHQNKKPDQKSDKQKYKKKITPRPPISGVVVFRRMVSIGTTVWLVPIVLDPAHGIPNGGALAGALIVTP